MKLYRITYRWNGKAHKYIVRTNWTDLLGWVKHMVHAGVDPRTISVR